MTKKRKTTKKPAAGSLLWYANEVNMLRAELRAAQEFEVAAKLKRKSLEVDLELALIGQEHADS